MRIPTAHTMPSPGAAGTGRVVTTNPNPRTQPMTKKDIACTIALVGTIAVSAGWFYSIKANADAFEQETDWFCSYKRNEAIKKGTAYHWQECWQYYKETVCMMAEIHQTNPYGPMHVPSDCEATLAAMRAKP